MARTGAAQPVSAQVIDDPSANRKIVDLARLNLAGFEHLAGRSQTAIWLQVPGCDRLMRATWYTTEILRSDIIGEANTRPAEITLIRASSLAHQPKLTRTLFLSGHVTDDGVDWYTRQGTQITDNRCARLLLELIRYHGSHCRILVSTELYRKLQPVGRTMAAADSMTGSDSGTLLVGPMLISSDLPLEEDACIVQNLLDGTGTYWYYTDQLDDLELEGYQTFRSSGLSPDAALNATQLIQAS